MKRILCFGDSNTYGYIPGGGGRYGHLIRWPKVLQKHLGDSWEVIEEGLNGRTTVTDDPIEGSYKNGRRYWMACLESHWPLDAVVLMLGTNDLKARFNKSANEIALGNAVLINDFKHFCQSRCVVNPHFVLMCPTHVLDSSTLPERFAGAPEKSTRLPLEFKKVASETHVDFFDAGSVVSPSEIDGFHLDEHAHQVLGEAVFEFLDSSLKIT